MVHRFLERHVPHLPERMFALVADLESYPRFVPNCKAMEVRRDLAAGGDVRLARMTVRFGIITQAYTSRVTLDPQAMTIAAHAADGPFQYLDSEWTFKREGMGTRIRFEIDFKFGNAIVASLAEPAFASKQDEIIDAFLSEADRRYGA